jgi:hypothetical protein
MTGLLVLLIFSKLFQLVYMSHLQAFLQTLFITYKILSIFANGKKINRQKEFSLHSSPYASKSNLAPALKLLIFDICESVNGILSIL